jgi:zinc transport system permease protein
MFEIFQYDFMVRAFLAGLIIAVAAPLIGGFLVVRGYSLMADTLAHVSLAGVAVGVLTKTYPVITAIGASVLAVILMEGLRKNEKVAGESLLALFLSGSLALAVVLMSLAKEFNTNFINYLFGSIATVSETDLKLIAGLGFLIVATVIGLYKEFYLTAFDEELAQANGLPVRRLNLIQMILAAVMVSLSIRVVGVLLIGALMVIPVLTSMLLGKSFARILQMSVGFSLIAVISGLFTSYYLDLASGGTIVLIALTMFCLVFFFKKLSV